MRFGRGFTLVEMLMAVGLAAFVLTVAYGFFNSIEKSGEFSKENNKLQSLVPPLYYVLLRDVESIDSRYGRLSVLEKSDGKTEVEFYTKSCFFFRGVCRVRYRLYKGYLFREELRLNSLSEEGVEVPLISGISSMEVFSSYGGEWNKGGGGRLIKFVFKLQDGEELPIVFKPRSQR
ncbi:PulJ/GspJ family protein [Phorcysia thermohydrogeniphila]|uniref:Prepilin-type N-terminal cleavage/methylation domain-containing protein n=1 Tax=Phorcysia thermohydrogeniphila TaxID=936138 RepID=A0A4R1GBA1_9BACT|nr:prepilin-type N-terminal cleavage/methylation domain-containing protein [Phorcysia thermohydrogeniphila]TCK04023.1 prepilin-type N-terminal cleavage/methylation domain-containing protein [Phorcysia thermohydrogeniphila]